MPTTVIQPVCTCDDPAICPVCDQPACEACHSNVTICIDSGLPVDVHDDCHREACRLRECWADRL